MDAAQALGELMELSSQITAAVVLEANGAVVASSSDDSTRAEALGAAIQELVSGGGRPRCRGTRRNARRGRARRRSALRRTRGRSHGRRDDGARSDVRARRLRPQNVRAGDRPAGAEEATTAQAEGGGGRGVRKLVRLAVLRRTRGLGLALVLRFLRPAVSAPASRTRTALPSSSSPAHRASSASRRSPAPRFVRDARRAGRAARRAGAARG